MDKQLMAKLKSSKRAWVVTKIIELIGLAIVIEQKKGGAVDAFLGVVKDIEESSAKSKRA